MEHSIDYELGEMRLTLNGQAYHLRLEHGGMRDLERILGEHEVQTAVRLTSFNIGSQRLATIIAVLSKSGEEKVEEIQDAVLKEGLAPVNDAVRDFFALSIRGFRPPETTAKPAKKNTAKKGTRSGS